MNAERAGELRMGRQAPRAKRSDADLRKEVRKLLGLGDAKIAAAKPRVVGTFSTRGRTIRKLAFDVEPGIIVPALDIAAAGSDRPSTSPVIVKAGVDWGHELAREGAVDELLKSPGRIVLINPRGMGETDPGDSDRRESPFGNDWKEAFLGIHLARPLMGQRVVDVLSVLEGLGADRSEGAGYHVVGVGPAGPVVLHAAFLDEKDRIKEITLERSLTSWEDLVKQGISRDQLGSVVPGALRVYDLPDLAARLAPRPVHIVNPVDATGQPVSGQGP